MANNQSRRASESTGCTMRPNRIPYTRTSSDVSISPKDHEIIRRASQSAIPPNRQFTVISGSPISKETRYRRSPSPRIIPSRTPSAQSSPSPCHEKDAFSTWISAFQPLGGRRAQRCFREAAIHPPISKSSLGELEVACIISNPKLRHDINFDRELHFRPNLDGERGRKKLLVADDYWVALEPELEKYSYMLSDANGAEFRWSPEWLAEFRRSQKRIPRLFNTIKDILITLTPDLEVPSADETLDVPLIMQQIERGVYDLGGLATWLATLLKAHCAPMRDQWVEKMVDLLSKGGAAFNGKMIVDGLKELFGIMEAMKLDIANHQIRYFRPLLLEDTITFEQRYYAARIAEGQVDTSAARTWLLNSDVETETDASAPTITSFTTTYLTSLLSTNPSLPETFTLDHDRLLLLRCDAHSLAYTDICLSALSRLLETHNRPALHATRATTYLRSVLPLIVGRAASDARWTSKAGSIAVETVRAALGRFPPTDAAERVKMEAPEEEIAVDGVAVCAELEAYLSRHLRADSELFQLRIEKLRSRLITRVTNDARRLEKLSLREVGEALLAPRTAAATAAARNATPQTMAAGVVGATKPSRVSAAAAAAAAAAASKLAEKNAGVANAELQADAAYEDVVARLTHIAVLHWRVWAPLVYVKPASGENMEWEGETST